MNQPSSEQEERHKENYRLLCKGIIRFAIPRIQKGMNNLVKEVNVK